MKRKIMAAVVLVGMLGVAAPAAWPGRVFAPYMYIGAEDEFKLTDCDDACGVKYYTLAFIIARQEGGGNEARYFKEPAWDGRVPIERDLYKEQIDAIRRRGGDVIMSFGGGGGGRAGGVGGGPIRLQGAYLSPIG